MKIQRHVCLFLVGLLLTLAAAASYGRVFMFWRSASQSTRALRDLGGKMAYESSVDINGADSHFSLFSFPESSARLMPRLRRAFGLKRFDTGTGVAIVRTGDTVLRLLALQLGNPDQTLVFKIEQSRADFESSNRRPTGNMLSIIPSFPGSEPEFYVKDENTDAALAVSSSDSAPEAIRDFFAARLLASGWVSALGPTDEIRRLLRDQSVALYIKRHHLCCVMVRPTGSGASRITLLHKTQGMK